MSATSPNSRPVSAMSEMIEEEVLEVRASDMLERDTQKQVTEKRMVAVVAIIVTC